MDEPQETPTPTSPSPNRLQGHFVDLAAATQRDGQCFSERVAVRRALEHIFAFVESQALVRSGDRVLDIGLGGGQLAETVRQRFGAKYAGVTIDPEEIARARRNGIGVERADMHDLPFPDSEFDVVWASHVLEHSAGPLVALREWARVLRPGGRLLLWGPIGRDFEGKDMGTAVFGCPGHLITPTEWQYRWMFELTGLVVESALDAPYQIRDERAARRHRRKLRLRSFLARLGLALHPRHDVSTAMFFALRKGPA